MTSHISATCSDDPSLAELAKLNEYCGFPEGSDGHWWCERFYIGELIGGKIVPCECECHRQPSQGALFAERATDSGSGRKTAGRVESARTARGSS